MNTPALVIWGNAYCIVDKEEFYEILSRPEAISLPSDSVFLKWPDGTVERRSVKTLRSRAIGGGIRGSSSRMSPSNPVSSGNVGQECFYYDLLDALVADTKSEFGENVRAVLARWKSARHGV